MERKEIYCVYIAYICLIYLLIFDSLEYGENLCIIECKKENIKRKKQQGKRKKKEIELITSKRNFT